MCRGEAASVERSFRSVPRVPKRGDLGECDAGAFLLVVVMSGGKPRRVRGASGITRGPPRVASSAANKAPLDVQGRGRYSFRCFRRACFGLFLAGFGLFLANFAHWGDLGAHLDVRRGALLTALPPPRRYRYLLRRCAWSRTKGNPQTTDARPVALCTLVICKSAMAEIITSVTLSNRRSTRCRRCSAPSPPPRRCRYLLRRSAWSRTKGNPQTTDAECKLVSSNCCDDRQPTNHETARCSRTKRNIFSASIEAQIICSPL